MGRARLAVLLLLIGLLLCAACGGEAAQERAPARPEAEQPSAAVPAVASTSAETQAVDASATTNGEPAVSEAAASEEADDCRIDAPPDGSKPLDLGTVTVHGDRPAAEARTIRERIAAVGLTIESSDATSVECSMSTATQRFSTPTDTWLHMEIR